jgi:glycosyltransferase involved in cell wall biosynthesis
LGIENKIAVRDVDYAMLPAQFRAAAVLANPRLVCSGIPQKLLNYMASGTAIVSFAGSAKILQHEYSGLVVADGDIPAFAAAILRLMSDRTLASRMGRTARQVVTEHHSWDQVAERVEKIYVRLLPRRDGSDAAYNTSG